MKLDQKFSEQKTSHLTLIDPDEQKPNKAASMALAAENGGTDAIMVGGSIASGLDRLENTVELIKDKTDLKVVLFPQDHSGLTDKADAVFFMSLLNSREKMYISGFQFLGAPLVKRYGLEVLPMAYLIVEPGGTVGFVGDAKEIPRDKPDAAVAYALTGQYMGMDYVYLEAGSGAEEPIPAKMVGAVKENIDVNLIIGGGIDTPKKAAKLSKAGADIIVTGTAIEEKDESAVVKKMVKAIKS
ncbi:geranylgeranylglyceryl/heptaprenylglyceryl phosphate synthase [archaeon SCG-AAA382B04]|nr:geranylgeranylglyceryl/heptaprenylglyceryl phosphate synthase [archaeon SCG-AAA382B04]